jgi:hypothetical protein
VYTCTPNNCCKKIEFNSSTNSVPNREGKRERNFASKEREEAKIQLLSPQRQISEATTGSRKRPDSRAGWPRADAVVLAWPAGGGVAPQGGEELEC